MLSKLYNDQCKVANGADWALRQLITNKLCCDWVSVQSCGPTGCLLIGGTTLWAVGWEGGELMSEFNVIDGWVEGVACWALGQLVRGGKCAGRLSLKIAPEQCGGGYEVLGQWAGECVCVCVGVLPETTQ